MADPKKKKTPEELAIESQMAKEGYAATTRAAEAKDVNAVSSPTKNVSTKNPTLISGGGTPDPNSTVLVGNKTGAQAISAEEYKKQQEEPKKKSILERLVRMNRRMR